MIPFDRSYRISYSFSVVNMDVSCIVSEMKRDIGRKSRCLHSLSVFDAPLRRIPLPFRQKIRAEKLGWWGWVYKNVRGYVYSFRQNITGAMTSKVKGQGHKATWSVWAVLAQWPTKTNKPSHSITKIGTPWVTRATMRISFKVKWSGHKPTDADTQNVCKA